MKKLRLILMGLSFLGILDALYLTFEHYSRSIPPCTTSFLFADCGAVLRSTYAEVFHLPVALYGALFYASLFVLFLLFDTFKTRLNIMVSVLSYIGLAISLILVFLQLFVIKAICLYCMLSAINTVLIFILVRKLVYESQLIIHDDLD